MYRTKKAKHVDNMFFLFIVLTFLVLSLSASPFFIQSFDTLFIFVFVLGLLVITGGGGFLYFLYQKERKRVRALTIANIDTMAGSVFERYVGELLKSQNYAIQFTPASGDYGVDIVANKDNDRFAVQIKRYKGLVGREAISDAVAGMRYYKCHKSMVVTNSYFSPNAKQLAAVNNCVLIDRDKLVKWIIDFQSRH